MASNQRKTFRFAVGSPEEYRSAIWRLWVQGNDVYLTMRSPRARIKAQSPKVLIKFSLHGSGIWRLAWTQESGLLAQGIADRVEKRWYRPSEFRPGWTQGPAVIVPHTGIQRPFRRDHGEDTGSVTWSPTPQPGYKHHFTILFASAQAPDDSWQTVIRPEDALLGTLDLRNGDKVVLCRREVPMVEQESSYIDGFMRDMCINYDTEVPEVNSASVFIFDTDDAGHPYALDIPLGWENVRGPDRSRPEG
jgi:hypothetical protein